MDPRDHPRTRMPRLDVMAATRRGTGSHSVLVNRLEVPRGTMAHSRSHLSDAQPAGISIQVQMPMARLSTKIDCLSVRYFAISRSKIRPT